MKFYAYTNYDIYYMYVINEIKKFAYLKERQI